MLPFSAGHIALIETFADQAAIAIENARLFNELGTRNRDLTEALDQQGATSEILRVMSASPTDVQPVFEAIAESAQRLCEAPSLGSSGSTGSSCTVRPPPGRRRPPGTSKRIRWRRAGRRSPAERSSRA